MEVIKRSKGLDLGDKVSEELWKEVHNIVQEVVTKTIPKKKKCKKVKWLSEESLQIAEKRREVKAKEKGKDIPNKCRVSEQAWETKAYITTTV